MDTTDVIIKRVGNNLLLNFTLNDEFISLKLHKTETSIPSSVPMYVSENGLVEQFIPDLYEVNSKIINQMISNNSNQLYPK